MLSFVSYHTQTSDPDRSHVTDLAIVSLDGWGLLYATTRLDGVISAWALDTRTFTPIDTLAYDQNAVAGGDPHLGVLGDTLLTADGVTPTGRSAQAPIWAPDLGIPLGR